MRSRSQIRNVIIVFCLAVTPLLFLYPHHASHEIPHAGSITQPLRILTAQGEALFQVELADTEKERRKGLMFRKDMPPDHGMLFDFGTPDFVSMWMHQTLIPLDMIFIDATGRILQIEAHTTPFSTHHVRSKYPVKAVLELNAGQAIAHGISVGDRIIHPLFK